MTSEENPPYADDEIKTYVDEGDEIKFENLSDDKKELVGDSDDEVTQTTIPYTKDKLLFSSPMIKSYPPSAQPGVFPFYSPEMCIGTVFPRFPFLPGSPASPFVPASITPFSLCHPDSYKVLNSYNHLQAADPYFYQNSTLSQQKRSPKKPSVKKPLNSFLIYLREMRPTVIAETNEKESSIINKILGKKWHELGEVERQKYIDMAKKEKELHEQKHPGWSAKDNYAKRKNKRKR